MKKFAAMAVIPLFAGFLYAQQESRTVTTTTWNGTLVDASCQSSHTVHKESSTKTNPDQSVTHKESSSTETVDCPVVTTTTTFGLLTPEGRYLTFDEPSNTKIVEVVKSKKDWNDLINDRKPRATRSDGSPKGDADWLMEQTLVGRRASIGSGAVIMCGVRIGEGALVGAGAVVTRDVPPGAVVVGNPARVHALAAKSAGSVSYGD